MNERYELLAPAATAAILDSNDFFSARRRVKASASPGLNP